MKKVKQLAVGGSGSAGPVSLVIAANNSDITAADVVCTGTNDHTTIQTAVNAAGDGALIFYRNGTYDIQGPIDTTAQDQTHLAESRESCRFPRHRRVGFRGVSDDDRKHRAGIGECAYHGPVGGVNFRSLDADNGYSFPIVIRNCELRGGTSNIAITSSGPLIIYHSAINDELVTDNKNAKRVGV